MKWFIAAFCVLLCLSSDPVQMIQAPFAGVDALRLRTQNEPAKEPNYAHR